MTHHLDSPENIAVHGCTINKNKFLRQVYSDFYQEFIRIDVPLGSKVELGSGGGFLKEVIPEMITSDVVPGPGIDQVISATVIPFPNESIAAFYMLNVLHHIKDPETALHEMERCLKIGGKIIMIEPYNSLLGRFFYKNFHYEGFDPKAGWIIPGDGRLSDANNAAPWNIFVRDQKIFEKKFPNLAIIKLQPHTPFAYILSGGLNHHSFLPPAWYSGVKWVEKLFAPFNAHLGMFVTIELQKN